MKAKIGFGLFSLGVAIGVTGGAKAPVEGQTWPDTLLIFGFGVGLAVVGLILWWQAERAMRLENSVKSETGKGDDPIQALRQLSENIAVLIQKVPTLTLDELRISLQALSERWVYAVVSGRQQVNNRLGMTEGANVMISFAYCERMINRAWSAAADNHREEALSSIQEAYEAIVDIVSKLPSE